MNKEEKLRKKLNDCHKALCDEILEIIQYKLSIDKVLELLHNTANKLETLGIEVIRRKTELVLFDDRSSKIQPCNGGCIECHLDDLKEFT